MSVLEEALRQRTREHQVFLRSVMCFGEEWTNLATHEERVERWNDLLGHEWQVKGGQGAHPCEFAS